MIKARAFLRPLRRPLATLAVFAAVACALLLGIGRVAMGFLDAFEGSANARLDGRARIEGLAGDWDGLNPLAKARRIDLPAGWIENITVELDVLESLRRGRPVLERLLVERAQLAVERTTAGWRLAGMEEAASEWDLVRLVGDIDEIRFVGRIAVVDAPESGLAVVLLGVNRDGAHAYDLAVSNPRCDAPCQFELHWRALDATWRGQPEEHYLTLSGGLDLPGAFLAEWGLTSGLRVRADGRWLERGTTGGGELGLRLDRFGLPGGALGSLDLEFKGVLRDGWREGLLASAELVADQVQLTMGPVHVRTFAGGMDLWTPRLTLGAAADLLGVALGEGEGAGRWLAALQPRGNLLNVRARVEPGNVAYAATLEDLSVESHRGVPWLRQAAGEIVGYGQGARLTLNGEALRIGLADVFSDRWHWRSVQGNLHAWFGDGYLGLRVPHFRFQTGGGDYSGAFSLARPEQRMRQRLAVVMGLDRLDVAQAKTYIPYHLSEGLRQWLREGPRAGLLSEVRVAYQGQVHTEPEDHSRRLAMRMRLSGGSVRYHADWPLVTEASGIVEVAGAETFADVAAARTQNAEIRQSRVRVGDNGAFAEVDLAAAVDTGDGLDFVRVSPLAQWLTFVLPRWSGTGRLGLQGQLYIPIAETNERPVACDLDIDLADVGLNMPNHRVAVARLNGPARFRCPHYLGAEPLAGELFGEPVSVAARADDNAIELLFRGSAAQTDLYQLLDVADPGFASGRLAFDAKLKLAVDDSLSTLVASGDLIGVEIDLPGDLAKAADIASPAEIKLDFLDEYVAARLRYGEWDARLHVDEVPLRGTVGVGRAAPVIAPVSDEVVVTGRLVEADVEEWLAVTGEPPAEERMADAGEAHGWGWIPGVGNSELAVPWRLDDLRVDRLIVDTLAFGDVLVAGHSRDDALTLEFASAHLNGRLRSVGEAPLDFEFDSIRLPEAEGEDDPLDVSIIEKLPDADVAIHSLLLGEENFGHWDFTLRRHPEGILVGDLRANLKGTEITVPDGVLWHAATNRSSGAVRLTMGDLGKVLPQWDYAPSLEAETAALDLNASWAGSPLNVEVNGLRGDVAFEANNGSFVEVSGTGAQRILGLLNFNTVLKRMSLNFKDLVAKGTSFDTIEAKTRFDDGLLTFVEPAKVKGAGSDFKIGGSVNLVDGIMNDNEMIVTLPVSDSLPWYAVYVSLANPVAAAAVLAGQQVLKKQIKQFSSAKYRISGSWDDPEVKLVGIWNDDLQDFDDLARKRNTAGDVDDGQTEDGP